MGRDHKEVWDNCLQIIREHVSPQSFKTWFAPIKSVRVNSDSLTIQVPNKFFYEYLEEHFVTILRKSIRSELGEDARLEYQILTGRKEGAHSKASSEGESTNGIPTSQGEIPNPFVIPGLKRMKVDPQLNPNYRFDNFIEGDCNRLARNAGKAIADNPGNTAFNPLFVYGDVGLGKTHLAEAIGNEVREQYPDKNILYVTTEKFTNQIIQSIKNNETNDLVNFYQMIDVLIVDDIHFLANKQKTQEIFFHIFNQLHQSRKQIVLTSDRPPKDLEDIQERLISRFKWGLSADLQAPEFETRVAIFRTFMENDDVHFPDEVVDFICYNVKSNIRELQGVYISLIAQESMNQQEISLPVAKEVLAKNMAEMSSEVTLENIQKLVADHFKLPVEKLVGKTRKRNVVIARQISMYLAKQLTQHTYKSIGEEFGKRDHSTVIYSCNAVQDQLDTDEDFQDTVKELQKKIKMSLNVN